MRKLTFLTLLILFLFSKELYSQDNNSNNFQVHINYINVKGKIRGGNDLGIGIGTEYHFNLIKGIGLEGLGGLGYDKMFGNCPTCDSEWFENAYWGVIGLSKKILIKERHQFVGQTRWRRVGLNRMIPEIIELDGTITRWQKSSKSQDLLGFRLGYFVPTKLPLVLSYTFEEGAYHRMNTISIGITF